MMDLKTAIKTKKVEEYMSTTPIVNFIKDYNELNDEEMKIFVNIVSKSALKNAVSFNINSKNIPPYPNF